MDSGCIVYLNGKYLPLEEARISVLDRGFIFGDAIYEVIPVFNGKVFRFDRHMRRMENSLAAIYMENPLPPEQWQEIFAKLIDAGTTKQSIYLQISRGVSQRSHEIDKAASPTVFVMCQEIKHNIDVGEGVAAITHEDIRWDRCNIKSVNLLACILLRHRARLAKAREALLFRDGALTEGAASNAFIVTQGRIRTPRKSNFVLPGITRDLLMELMVVEGIPCHEERIMQEEVHQAGEIWVASSTWGVVPVVMLDGQPVGSGVPGPKWRRIAELYRLSCAPV
ncbi:MAG: aminotransferase class IV [Candidatus Eutrophobiaceae bacterium]